MSAIQISELSPIGAELFQDPESFLNELNDQDLGTVHGGAGYQYKGDVMVTSVINIPVVSQASQSIGVSLQSLSVVSGFKGFLK